MSVAQPDPTEVNLERHFTTILRSANELKGRRQFAVESVRRNRRTGPVTRTGLPSTTSGAGGGGRGKGGISDPVGESATNRAMAELGQTDVIDDPFDAELRAAIAATEAAADAIGVASLAWSKLQKAQGEAPNVQWCEACEPAGVRHPWDRYARDLRGLVQPAHLCDAAYRFVDKNGRLPSGEEARYYDLKGRWKIRIDPQSTSVGVSA